MSLEHILIGMELVERGLSSTQRVQQLRAEGVTDAVLLAELGSLREMLARHRALDLREPEPPTTS